MEVKLLVSYYLSFICRESILSLEIPIYRFFPWSNNSTVFGLVQLEPTPIPVWWLNELA